MQEGDAAEDAYEQEAGDLDALPDDAVLGIQQAVIHHKLMARDDARQMRDLQV